MVIGARPFATLLILCALSPAQTSRPRPADPRMELGRLYAEQRYEDLSRAVAPLLVESKDAGDLWIMAAEAAFKLEDYPRAIKCFEKGVELAPAVRPATINLGFAYLKADQIDRAKAVFDGFLQDPNRDRAGKAWYGAGLALSARGDVEGSVKAFRESVALDPEDARPHYRLGQIALQAGDHPGAIAALTLAIKFDELHFGAAHGLARAYALVGNEAEAARWTERHRKILEAADTVTAMIRRLGSVDDPVAARIAIGAKLADAGAKTKAAAWYQRALKLDPANAEAAARLRELASGAESRR